MTRQAVILAGGKGTRLRERLNGKPKPLVDVDGVPLLERQLRLLGRHGFDNALILVNYAADQIEAFCSRGDFGISVTTVDDGEAKGTAGAVLAAFDELAPQFLVVYGDTLLDVDLSRFWKFHEETEAAATLFLHPNDHPHDSDLVEVNNLGDITGFHPYPHSPSALLPNLVNAALYVIRRDALQPWTDAVLPLDFAKGLFPQMVQAGQRLRGYTSFEYIKDIGTPARLNKAIKQLQAGVVERARISQPQKVIFFDRDGTLNELAGYIRHHSAFHLLPGVPEAIRRLNEAEYRIALATNQPVIARGEASLEDLRNIHNKLETELGWNRAWIDLILFCPHHPDAGFPGEVPELKIECACRKPGTGLVEEGRARLEADLSKSWFVGDSTTDIMTARRAGLRAILVRTGEGGRDGRVRITPSIVVDNVPEAVRFILEIDPALQLYLAPLVSRIHPGDAVMIGGRAGLGKSIIAQTLAWMIAERGDKHFVLELDRFIKSAVDREIGNVLTRYDLTAASAIFKSWSSVRTPKTLTLPWYDRYTRTQHPAVDSATVTPDTVLVIEGVPALSMAVPDTQTSSCRVHRVWVEGDEITRRERVIRTMTIRGYSPEEAEATYESREGDENRLIENWRHLADSVLTLDNLIKN